MCPRRCGRRAPWPWDTAPTEEGKKQEKIARKNASERFLFTHQRKMGNGKSGKNHGGQTTSTEHIVQTPVGPQPRCSAELREMGRVSRTLMFRNWSPAGPTDPGEVRRLVPQRAPRYPQDALCVPRGKDEQENPNYITNDTKEKRSSSFRSERSDTFICGSGAKYSESGSFMKRKKSRWRVSFKKCVPARES